MPYRVRTGGIHVTWTVETVDQKTVRAERWFDKFAMLGLVGHFGYRRPDRRDLFAFGPMRSGRPNWSRPLPQPLVIPDVMTLATLADVRALIEKHVPQDRRERPTWRHVAAEP
jgi:hypothetical protein